MTREARRKETRNADTWVKSNPGFRNKFQTYNRNLQPFNFSNLLDQTVMEWWRKLAICLRKFWIRAATRFGVPKSGLRRLRHDIMRCEYEDVHVLWELLKEGDKGLSGDIGSKKKRPFSILLKWAGRKSSPLIRCSV
ncbi:hypothetical protein L1887_44307 [Cichorium endivia]|nr:hypothetical protein L1887_44307 [Cichorium endivia]